MTLKTILDKILLGVSLASTIGPLNVEMIKRGLSRGFWAAFSIRIGGSITNSICLVIAYFGLGTLMRNNHNVIPIIYYVGSTVLIYMGITTIIKSVYEKAVINTNIDSPANDSYKNGILTGIMLAAVSPIGIMFWLTSFSASISLDQQTNLSMRDLGVNFFIILGVLLCGGFMSGLLYFGNKFINNNTLRIISILSGILLIYFGIKYGLHCIAINP